MDIGKGLGKQTNFISLHNYPTTFAYHNHLTCLDKAITLKVQVDTFVSISKWLLTFPINIITLLQ